MKAYMYAIYKIDNLTECLCPPLPYQGVDEPSNAATLKDKFPAIHALRSEVVSFAQKFPTVGFWKKKLFHEANILRRLIFIYIDDNSLDY